MIIEIDGIQYDLGNMDWRFLNNNEIEIHIADMDITSPPIKQFRALCIEPPTEFVFGIYEGQFEGCTVLDINGKTTQLSTDCYITILLG